jgi:hypothetical protein
MLISNFRLSNARNYAQTNKKLAQIVLYLKIIYICKKHYV